MVMPHTASIMLQPVRVRRKLTHVAGAALTVLKFPPLFVEYVSETSTDVNNLDI